MSLEFKRRMLKQALRIPKEILEDEEILSANGEMILIVYLRAVAYSLRILGEPKTDGDYLELFGKTEDELKREFREKIRMNNNYVPTSEMWRLLLENEASHRI